MTAQTAGGIAAGFEQYGFFPYLCAGLIMILLGVAGLFISGKVVFYSTVEIYKDQLNVSNAIMTNTEAKKLDELQEDLDKQTELIRTQTNTINELKADFMRLREDVRGGRPA